MHVPSLPLIQGEGRIGLNVDKRTNSENCADCVFEPAFDGRFTCSKLEQVVYGSVIF